MDIKKIFGAKVKALRVDNCWSQETLALNAELDRTYIPGIESGSRNVSLVTIEKLAKAYALTVSELLKF